MPFYQYFCSDCKDNFKTYHGADEKCESCPRCNGKEVVKGIPQITLQSTNNKEISAGNRVEKFIEESREILEADKRSSRRDYIP